MTGEEFDALLAELGWKKSELAARLGVNPGTVSEWSKNGPPAAVAEWLTLMQTVRNFAHEMLRMLEPAA